MINGRAAIVSGGYFTRKFYFLQVNSCVAVESTDDTLG